MGCRAFAAVQDLVQQRVYAQSHERAELQIGDFISFRHLLGQSSADGMLTQHGVGFRAIIRSTTYNQLTVLVHNLCRNGTGAADSFEKILLRKMQIDR